MEELEERLQKIFSKAVARALCAMDIIGASYDAKLAVKSTIWDTMDDVTKVFQELSVKS